MDRYEDPERPLHYRYKSVNRSLIDKYLLDRWWSFAIKAIPLWMPANFVSIAGNVGSWLAFILLAGLHLGPSALGGHPPSWVFLVAALCVAFYHTLDALDGKQARRTKSSGPLGEFVDHWFDSFNAFLLPLGLILAFPSLTAPAALALVYLFVAADFLKLEEVRKTGVLVFDAISADEGVFLNILLLLAIGFFGYDFWARPLVLGLSPIELLLVIGAGCLLVVCARCLAATGGFRRLAVEAGFLAPIAVWTILAEPSMGRPALLLGSLLLGFTASRFSGELLRERLMGLEYSWFPPDLAALDAALLATVLLPGISARVVVAVGAAALVWTLLALVLQFLKAVTRVEDVLGIGLFGPVERESRGFVFTFRGRRGREEKAMPAFVHRVRRSYERTQDAIRDLIRRS